MNFISFKLWPSPDNGIENGCKNEVKHWEKVVRVLNRFPWTWKSYRIREIWDEEEVCDSGVKVLNEYGRAIACLIGVTCKGLRDKPHGSGGAHWTVGKQMLESANLIV